jgi:hypothetical protein
MVTQTARLEKKHLGQPDGRKDMPKPRMEWVDLEEMTLGRVTLQPGWKWSQDIRPLVKTDSCQCPHAMYTVSGHMKVVMDDGAELELGPGDFAAIPPGHDAWVVGNEPYCGIDLTGFKEMRESMSEEQPASRKPR